LVFCGKYKSLNGSVDSNKLATVSSFFTLILLLLILAFLVTKRKRIDAAEKKIVVINVATSATRNSKQLKSRQLRDAPNTISGQLCGGANFVKEREKEIEKERGKN